MIKSILTNTKFLLLFCVLVFISSSLFAQTWQEKKKTHEVWEIYQPTSQQKQKIEALLSQMTLKEKVMQLASYYPNLNKRLGIPHLQAGECLHGLANSKYGTSFPQAIALGSTWDPVLIKQIATVIAREARAMGVHHCYSPNLGLARDPRWGRFEECYAEDPILVSQIGKAFIEGLQGTGKDRFSEDHIIATAKHFVADGRPQAGANGASEELSKRILHELYLKPYRTAVQEAHVGAIMPAHHSLNGEPCHSNTWLLQEVLKKSYGFDGIIVCDNGDIKGIKKNFRMVDTYEEAAKLALDAGVNAELAWLCPWGENRMYGPILINAVKQGLVSRAELDKAVAKILQYKMQLNLFGKKTLDESKMEEIENATEIKDYASTATNKSVSLPRENWKSVLFNKASNALALKSACKAMILLKNEANLLPLDENKIKNLALIGPNADDHTLLGTYSTSEPRYFVTVKEGLENLLKNKVSISYEKGITIGSDDRSGISAAVRIAKASDVVVLVLGDNKQTIKENQDRDDITLPGLQPTLMRAIVETGKPVVLVLLHGRTPALAYASEHVTAILDGWFLGQETGNAVAETLFGLNNPGGKTTVTYPRSTGLLPQCYNDLPAGRKHSIYKGTVEPVYPFGYGLSYTTFEYGKPSLSTSVIHSPDEKVYAEITVKNTGNCVGDEVVQLYIEDEISSRLRPLKELKKFQRITLKPNESKVVRLAISRSDLEFWKNDSWTVEPGKFKIKMGGSSLKTQTVELILK